MKKTIALGACLIMLFHFSISGQVVINEVLVKPGPSTTMNQGLLKKEYIELFNKGCEAVDISQWILGTASNTPNFTGSFCIPKNTIIQPGEFLIIGGLTSDDNTEYDSTDIDLDVIANEDNICMPGYNWILNNTEGWLALYNKYGQPIDAIYWTSHNNQPDELFIKNDYSYEPCVPAAADTSVKSLMSAREMLNEYYFDSIIRYVNKVYLDHPFQRIPDGGDWVTYSDQTIQSYKKGQRDNDGIPNYNPNLTLIVNNDTVKTSSRVDSLHIIDCYNDTIISSTKDSFYIINHNVDFKVVMFQSSCSDTSSCIETVDIIVDNCNCDNNNGDNTGGEDGDGGCSGNGNNNGSGSNGGNGNNNGSGSNNGNGMLCGCDNSKDTIQNGQFNIVINEVLVYPGHNGQMNQGLLEKEYIELFNKGCKAVDISQWILGTASDEGPRFTGAFCIPKNTIIQPGEFLIIGGLTSDDNTEYDSTDIDLDVIANEDNICMPGVSNWILNNTEGWLALYNKHGQPIDAIYWTFYPDDQDEIFSMNGYEYEPCVPIAADTSVKNLMSALDIFNNFYSDSIIRYVNKAYQDHPFQRIPDGGNWVEYADSTEQSYKKGQRDNDGIIGDEIEVETSLNGDTLKVAQEVDSIQVVNCDTDELIATTTNPYYVVNESGAYKIISYINYCSDTSVCEAIFISSITEHDLERVTLYPNPSYDGTITISNLPLDTEVYISTTNGKIIAVQKTKEDTIHLSGIASGMYFVSVGTLQTKKTLKLIVN